MGTKVIEVQVWTTASPDQTFAVIADARRWPEWSPIDAASLDEEGSPTSDGLGAVRRFTTGRITSIERVVEFVPGERFAYELVSGLPLKNYRAEVTLTPSDGGTAVAWRSTFDGTRVPGFAWLYRWQLAKFIGQLVEALARHTDTLAANGSPVPPS